MKKIFLPYLAVAMCLLSQPVLSQDTNDTTELLGLPGDNLDLYAVLTLFQKSKTIEAFEKSLNDEKTGINNLDLDLDKKVDFIKVTTKKDGNAFSFILQVDVTKTETQDVAVILVSKDEKDNVSIQMVGDPDLYGKDYVIEPKGNSSITANPGYKGEDPVIVNVPATQTIVVESAPIVQYVYSPAYVPYAPPYYYGGHYQGGNNNVVINTGNRNQVIQYNKSRNTSNTVSNNRAKGNYGNGSANRPTAGTSNRPSAGTSNRASAGTSNRASNKGVSSSSRPSASTANRSSSGFSSGSSGGGGGRSISGGGMRTGGGGRRR